MKNMIWVGVVATLAFPLLSADAQAPGAPAQTQAAAPANLSPGAAEVVRLAGSGVSDDVVLAYIQNSQAPFNLAADDVLYLKDLGLSPQVTSAMLSHDGTLRGQPQPYAPAAPTASAATPGNPNLTYNWQPPPAAAAPAPTAPAAPVAAPPPAYVTSAPADVSYFYNDLSPYGTWVSLEGYGWCWQPRAVVISRGWRPYCDGGHWVYSDVGWYWQSDYSWGWAPFHYGRWYMHPRCGWVWTPDRVWGPAWVTWRAAGDCCGWAPLPPRAEFDLRLGWRFNGVSVGANFDFGLGINAFAFVGFGDFCGHDLRRACLPSARVATIYRQTTVINNYEVHNNTIVHRGIPIERVAAVSRVAVPRATVRDWRGGPEKMPNRAGAVVYRPELKAPARPVNMAAQKVDARHPVIRPAPIAPARTQPASSFSRGGSAPGAVARRPVAESPKVSPWSSGARSTVAAPAQSAWRSYQPAPSVPPAATAPRAPDNWKQGARTAPGYRSDAGLPALANARAAGRSAPPTAQTAAENPHVYYPKSYRQAAEIRSVPSSDQSARDSSSPGRSSGSRSGKNQ